MELVAIVASVALLEYTAFVWRAGKARGEAGVPAPAMSGHPNFERHVRVQENTVEQLVLFVPMLWLATAVVGDLWAAEIGAVWVVGRVVYTVGYSKEAAKRGPGFLLTILPTAVLTVIALWGVIQAIMA